MKLYAKISPYNIIIRGSGRNSRSRASNSAPKWRHVKRRAYYSEESHLLDWGRNSQLPLSVLLVQLSRGLYYKTLRSESVLTYKPREIACVHKHLSYKFLRTLYEPQSSWKYAHVKKSLHPPSYRLQIAINSLCKTPHTYLKIGCPVHLRENSPWERELSQQNFKTLNRHVTHVAFR